MQQLEAEMMALCGLYEIIQIKKWVTETPSANQIGIESLRAKDVFENKVSSDPIRAIVLLL